MRYRDKRTFSVQLIEKIDKKTLELVNVAPHNK